MLDLNDRYKLEYAEVGNLRRHYSVVRSSLTTFCMTAALAAFGSYFSQTPRPSFLIYVGFFMLVAGSMACVAFSIRSERANLYMGELWTWFESDTQPAPTRFDDFAAGRCNVLREMLRDEMNWAMLVAFLAIGGGFLVANHCVDLCTY